MDTFIHVLEHIIGVDIADGKAYLFWSGVAQILFPIVAGVYGYFKLKAHHKRHMDALHNHISHEFSKLRKDEE